MTRLAAECIGTVFYIGKLPFAPGTWASLIATIFWYFLFTNIDLFFLPIVTIFLLILGYIASDRIVKNSKEHDPSRIVIDEWVGQWITFTMLPVNIYTGVIGFIAFRIIDIVKPGPVKRMERLPGGWGIMADDVLAGVIAYFVVLFSYWIFL
jgi:phosphatidylglycerophosphatase A